MRLLSTTSGCLELKSFVSGHDRPEYTILSHTWLADEDEVIFADLSYLSQAQQKPGWKKLQEARIQARRHGYLWIWIDTCCIDKSSSAELSEAINSTFRWYRDASLCLVFLDDVPDNGRRTSCAETSSQSEVVVPAILINDWTVADMEDDDTQYESFSRCRWLTRGWTLQEMLAPEPDVVKFFNAGWSSLGSLADLAASVARATGIDIAMLKSGAYRKAPNDCSIAQRMSWAASRRTTRPEDRAYSLLGLFGVNMPIIYGEGDRTFFRLQEAILQVSPNDLTILFWRPLPSAQHTDFTLLTTDLEDFKDGSDIAIHPQIGTDFELLTHGERLTLPVFSTADDERPVLAALPCRSLGQGNMFTPCLRLQKDRHTQTYSVTGRHLEDSYVMRNARMKSITVRHVNQTLKLQAQEERRLSEVQSALFMGIEKILVRGSTLSKDRDRFTERGLVIWSAHPKSQWHSEGAYFTVPYPLPAISGFRAELSFSFHFAHNREVPVRLFISLASIDTDASIPGYKVYEWTTYKRSTMDFALPDDKLADWMPEGLSLEGRAERCVRPWFDPPKGWEVEAVMKVLTVRDEVVLVVEMDARTTGEAIEYETAPNRSTSRPIHNMRKLQYRQDRPWLD